MRRTVLLLLIAFLPLGVLRGDVVVDQEQPLLHDQNGLSIFRNETQWQQVAQTFVVGLSGRLVGVRAPVRCASGELVLEIVSVDSSGRPGPTVLASSTVSASEFPSYSIDLDRVEFTEITLDDPLPVTVGQRLAFVLRIRELDDECGMRGSPEGDLYRSGAGYFESNGPLPGWRPVTRFDDLPFQTLMADPTPGRPSVAGDCVIPGRIDPARGGPVVLPMGRYTPACRCFRDQALREFRCGILHPDFVIIRRIPLPLTPAMPFTERWEIQPFKPLEGPIRVSLSGAGFKTPVKFEFSPQEFDLKSSAMGGYGKVIELKAKAPAKAFLSPGIADFEYRMMASQDEAQSRFSMDISLEEELFK